MSVSLQGNLVKKAHKKLKYSDKMLADLAKCSDPDTGPMYFMENFLQIQHPTKGAIKFEPFAFQKNLIIIAVLIYLKFSIKLFWEIPSSLASHFDGISFIE